MGRNCAVGMEFPVGVMKCFGTREGQWLYNFVNKLNAIELLHFPMVNFMVSEFHLNKKFKKRK